MARPKLKKNRYAISLTPVSNFKLVYYNDDEEVEAEWNEATFDNVIRQMIRHNKAKNGDEEFILQL